MSQRFQGRPLHSPHTQGVAMNLGPVPDYPPRAGTSRDWTELQYHGNAVRYEALPLHTPIQGASYAAWSNQDREMQPTGQAPAPHQSPSPTVDYQYYEPARGATGGFVSTDITAHHPGYHGILHGHSSGFAAYNTAAPAPWFLPTQYPLEGNAGQLPASDLGPRVPRPGGQILTGLTVPDNSMMTGPFPGNQHAPTLQGWAAGSSMASGVVAQTGSPGRPSPFLSPDPVPSQPSPSSCLSPERVVQCPSCNRVIRGQDKTKDVRLQRHMRTHDPRREKFACGGCALLSTRKDNLRKHQLKTGHKG